MDLSCDSLESLFPLGKFPPKRFKFPPLIVDLPELIVAEKMTGYKSYLVLKLNNSSGEYSVTRNGNTLTVESKSEDTTREGEAEIDAIERCYEIPDEVDIEDLRTKLTIGKLSATDLQLNMAYGRVDPSIVDRDRDRQEPRGVQRRQMRNNTEGNRGYRSENISPWFEAGEGMDVPGAKDMIRRLRRI